MRRAMALGRRRLSSGRHARVGGYIAPDDDCLAGFVARRKSDRREEKDEWKKNRANYKNLKGNLNLPRPNVLTSTIRNRLRGMDKQVLQDLIRQNVEAFSLVDVVAVLEQLKHLNMTNGKYSQDVYLLAKQVDNANWNDMTPDLVQSLLFNFVKLRFQLAPETLSKIDKVLVNSIDIIPTLSFPIFWRGSYSTPVSEELINRFIVKLKAQMTREKFAFEQTVFILRALVKLKDGSGYDAPQDVLEHLGGRICSEIDARELRELVFCLELFYKLRYVPDCPALVESLESKIQADLLGNRPTNYNRVLDFFAESFRADKPVSSSNIIRMDLDRCLAVSAFHTVTAARTLKAIVDLGQAGWTKPAIDFPQFLGSIESRVVNSTNTPPRAASDFLYCFQRLDVRLSVKLTYKLVESLAASKRPKPYPVDDCVELLKLLHRCDINLNPRLMAWLDDQIASDFESLNGEQIGNLLQAYARLRHLPNDGLLGKLHVFLASGTTPLDLKAAAQLLDSLVELALYPPPSALSRIYKQLEDIVKDLVVVDSPDSFAAAAEGSAAERQPSMLEGQKGADLLLALKALASLGCQLPSSLGSPLGTLIEREAQGLPSDQLAAFLTLSSDLQIPFSSAFESQIMQLLIAWMDDQRKYNPAIPGAFLALNDITPELHSETLAESFRSYLLSPSLSNSVLTPLEMSKLLQALVANQEDVLHGNTERDTVLVALEDAYKRGVKHDLDAWTPKEKMEMVSLFAQLDHTLQLSF